MALRLAVLTTIYVFIVLYILLGSVNASEEAVGSSTIVFTVLRSDNRPVEDGLRFVVLDSSGSETVLETVGGRLMVPSKMGAHLVGPLVGSGDAYLPINISLDSFADSDLEPVIVLERAVVVKFVELFPWIDGSPLTVHYRLELESEGSIYPKTMRWSHYVEGLKRVVGLGEGEVLVPLSLSYRLYGEFESAEGGVVSWTADLTRPIREAQPISLLHAIYPQAIRVVENIASEARSKLENLTVKGVYLGYQLAMVERARERIESSREMFEQGRLRGAYQLLRRAYMDLVGINAVLSGYNDRQVSGGVLFPLFMVLGALTFSHLVFGEKKSSILAGLGLISVITFGFMAIAYPFLLPSDAWGWSTLLYSILAMLGLFLSIPSLGLEIRTQRGVALLAASSLAFSVASRFLKTRPLRTWIMVVMAAITVSSTLLLINTGIESQVFVSSPLEKTSPPDTPYIVAYSREYRYDNLAAVDMRYVSFFRSLGLDVGLRAETPIAQPSGREYYINNRRYNLRGIIGVSGNTPLPKELLQCIISGEVDNVGLNSSASVISQDLAENLGVSVGSQIIVNGLKLRVVGIIGIDCPTYLKDVDGYFASTLIRPPMSPVTPAGWSNVIVTGLDEALRLGAVPTKIYVVGGSDDKIYELAEVISLHTNLKVRVIKSGGEVYVFNLVGLRGISGGEALVVASIAFLNLMVASLANYYERRGEFFTMSTLGLNPGHILLLTLAEAIFLGTISAFLGILVALVVLKIVPAVTPIPIDFKLSVESLMGVLALSAMIFITSHIVSVRRSIILTTPAQTWKWVLTKALDDEGYWKVELPAKLRASRIKHFITYISSRLSEYSYTTTVNINVQEVKEDVMLGVYRIRFIYSSTEQRSFRAACILEVYRRGEWCSLVLRSKIEAQDARFIDQYIREITQLIRQFTIEYASLTIRILVPLGRDLGHIMPLLSVYNPSEVKLIWRGMSEEDLRGAVEELERNMVRVAVVRLSSSGPVAADAKTVIEAAKGCDLVCISSDDGYLSSIALLAAQRLNKRICIVKDSMVIEATAVSLWEQLR
ncbi:hypothetical protein HRbin02_00223 [Candidatus Calditenuaceae archaeon HR02]|nr:hypothetical protein HRbin02_00223 [Candidatus Calditenuaceae archaeon HR02]